MTSLTSLEQLPTCLEQQRNAFIKNPYPSYKKRRENLLKLKALLIDNQAEIAQALNDDFGNRCDTETIFVDILTNVSQINFCLKKLKRWMAPERRSAGMLFLPARAEIHYQPLGVVGIVCPWNYPIFLSIGPLTSALAAGNRAMIKMSEFTPATNQLMSKLLAEKFDPSEIAIVEGALEISKQFVALKFDHILFTGSINAGRSVLATAAENLVPVTLELGGKSPCILAEDYPVKTFVRNVLTSKILNSGQTCVAPDTLYCHSSQLQNVISELKLEYSKLYPKSTCDRDITMVINDNQWQRIQNLVEDAKDKGAELIPLIDYTDDGSRTLPLTLAINTNEDMLLSQQEIFGPILPIILYQDINDLIEEIQSSPRALALYLFTNNTDLQSQVLYQTHSGGVCINDAAIHVGVDDLPFGGVGQSGMGSYRSEQGFKTFSHGKSVVIRGKINLTPLFGPPYRRWMHKILFKWFLR